MNKIIFLMTAALVSSFIMNAQTINFPDVDFKQELIQDGIDTNNDGEIQLFEASVVTFLFLTNPNIDDLAGIEHFSNLESLTILNTKVSSLNFNSNVKLKNLSCRGNEISTLIINQCTELIDLNFSENLISSIDLSQNTKLEKLKCFSNTLTSITIPSSNLRELHCWDNQLASLDVSNYFNLERLLIHENQISSLNLSQNQKLDDLECSFNPLLNLDLSQNTNLRFLKCSSTSISSLDLSNNPLLGYVESENGILQEIIFHNNSSNIYRIKCKNNQLTSLEITNMPRISFLNCSDNNLTDLRLKNNFGFPFSLLAEQNPDLYCVEVNDPDTFRDNNQIYLHPQVRLNTNCSNDDDNDGIFNNSDKCQSTAFGDTVDSNGCSVEQNADDDMDGVNNGMDKCSGTISGATVNEFGCSTANIVFIPDENFKKILVNLNCVDTNNDGIADQVVDVNGDGEIQKSEANAVLSLLYPYTVPEFGYILDLTGLDSFFNLVILDLSKANFHGYWAENPDYVRSFMDFTALTQLEKFALGGVSTNVVKNIDLSGLSLLTELDLSNNRDNNVEEYTFELTNVNLEGSVNVDSLTYYNSFLSFDFCQVPNITYLNCAYLEGGEPDIFDFSCLGKLKTLNIDENLVNILILKNGSVLENLPLQFGLYEFPNYICIDELPGETEVLSEIIGPNTVVNSYCSFNPGGEYFIVEGTNYVDSNGNGCDDSDPIYPNLNFSISNGNDDGAFITDDSGNYSLPLQTGSHTITPILENPDYFEISPSSITVDFPSSSTPLVQNFCLSPIPGLKDLEVTIYPIELARPGFDVTYKILYKNKGTTTISGSTSVTFQDDILDFVTAIPVVDNLSSNKLEWEFQNLLAFESREIILTMNLNSPIESPAVNDGDVLSFVAAIAPENNDQTPNDNVFELLQTVVNSFDPNDKTCLEGNTITPDLIGEYVHYLIRCENTGTAEAVNIVIKDVIDTSKFDISTLFITDSSHPLKTNITGNVVEFIFEEIYLPFDDANNDGYVLFKIKTLPTLQIGDTFENDAEIFFDYNAPIITNTATTQIDNSLNIKDVDFDTNTLKLYPNPATKSFNIESEALINSVSIYSISGRLIQNYSFIVGKHNIEITVQNLSSGSYFIKINKDTGSDYRHLIRQ